MAGVTVMRRKTFANGRERSLPFVFAKGEEAFAMFSSVVEFVPSVKPENYRLFQAADFICTVTLVALKAKSGVGMTKSEFKFFGSPRIFERNVLRKIKAKEI